MIGASIRRLEVFKTVVETERFSSAADRLGIAQPSVSAHIKALESRLGQSLFVRQRGQPPRLTKTGEALYTYAANSVARAAEMQAKLRETRIIEPDRFTLAAQRNLANLILPRHLASFLRVHPQAKIATYSEIQERVLAMIREGEADLALFLAVGPASAIRSEIIGQLDLEFIVAPDHALSGRAGIAPEELFEHSFVGGIVESNFARMIATVLRRMGVREYDVVMQLQDSAAVKEMVRLGAGGACTLSCAVAAEIAEGTLVPLDLSRQPDCLQVRWAYAEDREVPAVAFAFIQYLKGMSVFA